MSHKDDIYYDEDRDKIEKANKIEDLQNLEKVLLEPSDALTSTIILHH
ncbi:hypothetical protein G9F73_015885 [Clostridium estertheticum]|nr:hypothetical protein [Clostridium estertheticum]MBZ9609272.1 hypothetical protein [Clostridium estertheticum]